MYCDALLRYIASILQPPGLQRLGQGRGGHAALYRHCARRQTDGRTDKRNDCNAAMSHAGPHCHWWPPANLLNVGSWIYSSGVASTTEEEGACFMWTDLRATESRLPYRITQCYLPPDTSERTRPRPKPGRPVLDLPTTEGWKAELTLGMHKLFRERLCLRHRTKFICDSARQQVRPESFASTLPYDPPEGISLHFGWGLPETQDELTRSWRSLGQDQGRCKQGRRSLWDGGTRPPNIWTGGHYHECPPNISRVISATFYPCNIFLISWKSF